MSRKLSTVRKEKAPDQLSPGGFLQLIGAQAGSRWNRLNFASLARRASIWGVHPGARQMWRPTATGLATLTTPEVWLRPIRLSPLSATKNSINNF